MNNVIHTARELAKECHKGQKDDSGEIYYESHLCQVAELIMVIAPSHHNLIAAAYLHDTIEDTDMTYEMLKEIMGQDIADLVHEVTQEWEDGVKIFPRLHTQRGILLKFADRTSNLSRLDCWNRKRQQQYLRKSKFWKSSNQ